MKGRKIDYVFLSRFLVPVGILICIAGYQYCFSDLIASYKHISTLSDASTHSTALSISPAFSTRRQAAVDSIYRRFRIDSVTWKNDLWNHCAQLSQRYDCSIVAFPDVRFVDTAHVKVLKQEVIFTGYFHQLKVLQHDLDSIKNIGVLGGLNYQRNPRSNATILSVQIFAISDRRQ